MSYMRSDHFAGVHPAYKPSPAMRAPRDPDSLHAAVHELTGQLQPSKSHNRGKLTVTT